MRVNESRTKPTPVPECDLEPMVRKSGGAQEAAQELNTSKRKKNVELTMYHTSCLSRFHTPSARPHLLASCNSTASEPKHLRDHGRTIFRGIECHHLPDLRLLLVGPPSSSTISLHPIRDLALTVESQGRRCLYRMASPQADQGRIPIQQSNTEGSELQNKNSAERLYAMSQATCGGATAI